MAIRSVIGYGARSNEAEPLREETSMSVTKKALAAAAVLGLAGALLSPPALAIVSVGSDPVRSVQTLHPGIFLAEAEGAKKKATKAKTKATKAKKPAATSKGGKAKGGGGSGSGEYD
jgi:hypothetical protein